jgi:hypothetical protein
LDVIDEDESSTPPQDSGHFGDGPDVVGNCAQPEGANDSVERGVVERQSFGVTMKQRGTTPEHGRPAAGDVEHGLAEVDAGQGDVVGIGAKVEPGPDSHFQHRPGRLPARPGPGVVE